MEDSSRILEFQETTESIVARDITDKPRNRRSSILKPQKPRNPLQDLDFNPTLTDETTVTRKSRRVSFAAGSQIKEFHEVRTEVANVTVWGPSYEQTIPTSGSDSSHNNDFTNQYDSSNITNIDALVTGKIHTLERNRQEDFENTPVDLRNNCGAAQGGHRADLQGNHGNARKNDAGLNDTPLDLTLGTSRPASSNLSSQISVLKGLSHSQYGGHIISGSMFQNEYTHHSIKTTFYAGDDEMDLSVSMRDENSDDFLANIFNKSGFVNDRDLSSSNDVHSKGGEQQANCRGPQNTHQQNLNRTVLAGNMDFTEPITSEIFEQSINSKFVFTNGQSQGQTASSNQFKSQVGSERDVYQENTVFAGNMDFTEPVNVHVFQSKFREQADKTLFDDNMDFTVPVGGNISTFHSEVDDDMEIDCQNDSSIVGQNQNQQLNNTCYMQDMDFTKPVHSKLPDIGVHNLDRTAFGEEMDMTRPINAKIIEQFTSHDQTEFLEDMEFTRPVNALLVERQIPQLNRTTFVEDMEFTKPVNAATLQQQTPQLNRTTFVEDMEFTKPVNAAMLQQQTPQLNRTTFVEDMEFTKPVNAATLQQQTPQLNRTTFVEDMEFTKPVNAAMLQQQTPQLNRTTFVEDMEFTKPVNAAMLQQQTPQLNRTTFVEDMEFTKPVNAAMRQQQTPQLNKTAFDDKIDMTGPVDVSMIAQQNAANVCTSVNSSVFNVEQSGESPNALYYFSDNDVAEITCTSVVSPPGAGSLLSESGSPKQDPAQSKEQKPHDDKMSVQENKDFTQANNTATAIPQARNDPDNIRSNTEKATLEQDVLLSSLQARNIGNASVQKIEVSTVLSGGRISCDQNQINESTGLQSPISSTSSVVLGRSIEDTLKKLKVLPVPEFLSQPAYETETNVPETVPSALHSENCLDSHDPAFVGCDMNKCEDSAGFGGLEDSSCCDEKTQQSEKRPRVTETSFSSPDVCSPPKQICIRTIEEEVLLEASQISFQIREATVVSSPEVDTSLLCLEQMDDSFVINEALILRGEEKSEQENSRPQSPHNLNNSHSDSITDEVLEIADNSVEMVPAIVPVIHKPETIEEVIRKLGKRSSEWEVLELQESTWTFSFFCETLDLVLELEPSGEASERKVVSINFLSHRTEKSKDLCHFAHKQVMAAFPVEAMHMACTTLSDVEGLLDSISSQSAKIQIFVDNFVVLQTSYGMQMKNEQKCATARVTSYPLFSNFRLTINLERSWESFDADDIAVVHFVGRGETIQTDVIKTLAKGAPAGPHCLRSLFLDIKKYIANLEKYRPPGPLRFD